MIKKRKISLFLGLTMMMSCLCGQFNGFAANAAASGENIEIDILGTSDVHGRFLPWEYATDSEQNAGSLSKISTFVKDYRKAHDNVILVDCGDSVQDNYVESLIDDDSNPMVTGMNELNYDVWVMGNHEYNFTKEQRAKLINSFKGTALSGNVYNDDGSRYLPATTIIEKSGVKIGIIGITTPMITEFEKGKNSLDGVKVNDALSETKKAIEELNGKVDAIVGVMHMGEENENTIPNTGVKDIANACPEIDAIVAGHMHLDVSSDMVNGVLITEPYKYGQEVSEINLNFVKHESGIKLVDKKAKTTKMKDIESDKDMEAVLQPYHQKLRDKVNQPIGKLEGKSLAPVDEIKGISSVYTQPTGVMNLFLDVARFYGKCDVAALCTDNEKAQMNPGNICIKDISKNYTYTGGEITVYKMTGADLKKYMEWSAEYFNTIKDGDLTISYNPNRRNSKYSTNDIFGGINYQIDLREESGNRIKNMTLLDGTPVEDDTVITIGMNSYRLGKLQEKGGIFEGKEFEQVYSTIDEFGEDQGTVRNLTIKYIQEEKNGVFEGNFTKNWEIVGIDKTSEDYKKAKELINNGIIKLPVSSDGKWTNIRSIRKEDLSENKCMLDNTNKGVWKTQNSRWYYEYSDGTYAKSQWLKVDNDWYLFDDAGWMLTGWQKVGDYWYLLNQSGAMATGWVNEGKISYHLSDSGEMDQRVANY
ncbi:MAG: bifunctional metallophosphatase/5'-nucleotidase [Clostridium butyricum]|nr:bifunctional metallophosphatase/5'-nucleotidase [Clostridium butyricum]